MHYELSEARLLQQRLQGVPTSLGQASSFLNRDLNKEPPTTEEIIEWVQIAADTQSAMNKIIAETLFFLRRGTTNKGPSLPFKANPDRR